MTAEEIKKIVDDERAEQLTALLCRHWEVATQRLDTLALEANQRDSFLIDLALLLIVRNLIFQSKTVALFPKRSNSECNITHFSYIMSNNRKKTDKSRFIFMILALFCIQMAVISGKNTMFVIKKCVNHCQVNADSFTINNFNMNNNERVIQLFITTKNVADKERENHYVINGINSLEDVNKRLHFKGNEAVYVHLNEPIEPDEANKLLCLWCKSLVDNGLVNAARLQRMGMPVNGEGYHSTYGAGNSLLEERFMITYV